MANAAGRLCVSGNKGPIASITTSLSPSASPSDDGTPRYFREWADDVHAQAAYLFLTSVGHDSLFLPPRAQESQRSGSEAKRLATARPLGPPPSASAPSGAEV